MQRIDGVIEIMSETKNVKVIDSSEGHSRVQIIRGSDKIVNIPHFLSEDLSYLVAAIICDGHIKKEKHRICFDVVDIRIVKKFLKKMNSVFGLNAAYRKKIDKRENRKINFIVRINSKPIVIFLNKFFEIPRGRKSDRVRVPEKIMKSDLETKKAFLEGVFDTDGGKRRRGLGLSSASKEFRNGVFELLLEFNISVYKDEWINKKYNKKYYGLYFKGPKCW